jgi:fructose-1,6-bisphosphatase/sedoheptulose 1,7-bisphosphatase-like protein
MRKVLNSIQMEGTIVIGEGEKDEVRAQVAAS